MNPKEFREDWDTGPRKKQKLRIGASTLYCTCTSGELSY